MAQRMGELQAAVQILVDRAPPPLPPQPVLPAVPVVPDPAPPLPGAFPMALTPLPKRYSGDPLLFKQFITQCELQYMARPEHFNSDSRKVNLMLMLLEGNALKWATPYIERKDPLLLNHTLFLQEFGSVFERQYHRLSRRQEFLELRQGNMDVVSYVAEFQTLAAETTWDEEAKIALFHSGLKEDIKDAILAVHPVPETMNTFIGLALRIEHRLGERKNRRKTEFRGYPVPGKQVPPPIDQSEPMVLGAERNPLTTQERDRRRKNFLCFYCGQAGHSIRQCPVKPPKGNAPAAQEGVLSSRPTPSQVLGPVSGRRATHLFLPGVLSLKSGGVSVPVTALIDCGAPGSYIDRSFFSSLGARAVRKDHAQPLSAIDGTTLRNTPVTHHTPMLMWQGKGLTKEPLRLDIIHSPIFPVILGMDWLTRNNPMIDWVTRVIQSSRGRAQGLGDGELHTPKHRGWRSRRPPVP